MVVSYLLSYLFSPGASPCNDCDLLATWLAGPNSYRSAAAFLLFMSAVLSTASLGTRFSDSAFVITSSGGLARWPRSAGSFRWTMFAT